MIKALALTCVLAVVAAAPQMTYDPSAYSIMYDGPEGRHVQMGEPGKAVSGYYTSRSDDGQMEYKVMYEADEKGFRARGDHLPDAKPAAAARSDGSSPYIFNYDSGKQSHYQMGEPGKAVEGSYMYYDPEGRARRVDYIADDKGYRVKTTEPAADEEVVAIKAVDPVVPATKPVEVAPAAPAPAVPEVAKLPPVQPQPAPVVPEFALKPAVAAPVVAVASAQLVPEPKSGLNQPIAFHLPHVMPYYHGALPYRFAPYSFGFAHPTGNYAYAL